jgi:hypothetical protein
MYHIKTLEKEDIFSIMEMINQNVGDKPLSSEKLRTAFDVWWEKLKPRIEEIKSRKLSAVAPPKRTEREILEEVLDTVRSLQRPSPPYFFTQPSTVYLLPLSGSISEAQTFFPSAIGLSNAERIMASELK